MKKNRCCHTITIMVLATLITMLTVLWNMPVGAETVDIEDTGIHLIIDGRQIQSPIRPMIVNDRTLVPVRIISEELGAEVTWDGSARTVFIKKDNHNIMLRIDSFLIEYTVDGSKNYYLSDVAPRIYFDRTFVPLRLISNALGVGVNWEDLTRTVSIDSKVHSTITPIFDMKITSVQSGQTITGTTSLQVEMPSEPPRGAFRLDYMIIDPNSGKGFVISRSLNFEASYQWLPSMRDSGERILVAAFYDSKGNFLCGDALPVVISIFPQASLTGLVQNQNIAGSIDIGASLNFSAAYVKYEITNTDNGKIILTTEQDPMGTFKWIPSVEFNGNVTVKVIAYDENDRGFESSIVNILVQTPHKIALNGVASGQIIENPVNLSVSRNFDVTETEYFLRDTRTGNEKSLLKVGYGNLLWFPGQDTIGTKEVFVSVKGTDGITYASTPIPVIVSGTPKIILQGVGPNQVITIPQDEKNAVKLKVASNTGLSDVKFIIINTQNGNQKVLTEIYDVTKEFIYIPAAADAGNWYIKAVGTDDSGRIITSEEIPVRIFTGQTYASKPIIEKSKFLSMATALASNDWKKSGMSAALQTAQSILETGWGQSVPVDKYSGQLSYNIFGIKGSGPAGSVISNTWEEYNGVSYRTDANFRAYNNIEESWSDHNKLLLTKDRYAGYREVMFDSTFGAWALKRAGYATDSQYPVKLIRIIKQYNLEELDQVTI